MTTLSPSFDKGADDKPESENINRLASLYVGLTQGGKPFAEYEYHRSSEPDSYEIQIGRNGKGETVVSGIERRGTNVDTAWKGIEALGLPAQVQRDMAKKLTEPDEIIFGGLQFKVGGPAKGTLVDRATFEQPEVQAVLRQAEKNFEIASFSTLSFAQPDQHAAPAAAPAMRGA